MPAPTKLDSVCEECFELTGLGAASLQELCASMQRLTNEVEQITSFKLPTLNRAVEQFQEKHLKRPVPVPNKETLLEQRDSVGVLLGGIDSLFLQCKELRGELPPAGARLPKEKGSTVQTYAVGYSPEYVQSRSYYCEPQAVRGHIGSAPSTIPSISARASGGVPVESYGAKNTAGKSLPSAFGDAPGAKLQADKQGSKPLPNAGFSAGTGGMSPVTKTLGTAEQGKFPTTNAFGSVRSAGDKLSFGTKEVVTKNTKEDKPAEVSGGFTSTLASGAAKEKEDATSKVSSPFGPGKFGNAFAPGKPAETSKDSASETTGNAKTSKDDKAKGPNAFLGSFPSPTGGIALAGSPFSKTAADGQRASPKPDGSGLNTDKKAESDAGKVSPKPAGNASSPFGGSAAPFGSAPGFAKPDPEKEKAGKPPAGFPAAPGGFGFGKAPAGGGNATAFKLPAGFGGGAQVSRASAEEKKPSLDKSPSPSPLPPSCITAPGQPTVVSSPAPGLPKAAFPSVTPVKSAEENKAEVSKEAEAKTAVPVPQGGSADTEKGSATVKPGGQGPFLVATAMNDTQLPGAVSLKGPIAPETSKEGGGNGGSEPAKDQVTASAAAENERTKVTDASTDDAGGSHSKDEKSPKLPVPPTGFPSPTSGASSTALAPSASSPFGAPLPGAGFVQGAFGKVPVPPVSGQPGKTTAFGLGGGSAFSRAPAAFGKLPVPAAPPKAPIDGVAAVADDSGAAASTGAASSPAKPTDGEVASSGFSGAPQAPNNFARGPGFATQAGGAPATSAFSSPSPSGQAGNGAGSFPPASAASTKADAGSVEGSSAAGGAVGGDTVAAPPAAASATGARAENEANAAAATGGAAVPPGVSAFPQQPTQPQSVFPQPQGAPGATPPDQSGFVKAPAASAFPSPQQPTQAQSAFPQPQGAPGATPPDQSGFVKAPAASAFPSPQQPTQAQSVFPQPQGAPGTASPGQSGQQPQSQQGVPPQGSAFPNAPAASAFNAPQQQPQAPPQPPQSAFGKQAAQPQQGGWGNASVPSAYAPPGQQTQSGFSAVPKSAFGSSAQQASPAAGPFNAVNQQQQQGSGFGKPPVQSAFANNMGGGFGQQQQNQQTQPQGFGSVPQNAFGSAGGSAFQKSSLSSLAGNYAQPTQPHGVFGSQ